MQMLQSFPAILPFLLLVVAPVLLVVLLVSGLLRLRRFSLQCLDELRRSRFELAKLAEEVSLIRREPEKITGARAISRDQ